VASLFIADLTSLRKGKSSAVRVVEASYTNGSLVFGEITSVEGMVGIEA